jgi:hypothetical protein
MMLEFCWWCQNFRDRMLTSVERKFVGLSVHDQEERVDVGICIYIYEMKYCWFQHYITKLLQLYIAAAIYSSSIYDTYIIINVITSAYMQLLYFILYIYIYVCCAILLS